MKIYLIAPGNLDQFQKKIFDEYLKRITLFQVFLKEINIKGDLEKKIRIEKESEAILKQIHVITDEKPIQLSKNRIILLDILGKNLDSNDFTENLIKGSMEDISLKNLIFIIGGSFGVNQKVKLLTNLKLSFGLNTWPHNLMKIMLIEQIFRAQAIILNTKYHH